jgi:hypothetical protein
MTFGFVLVMSDFNVLALSAEQAKIVKLTRTNLGCFSKLSQVCETD